MCGGTFVFQNPLSLVIHDALRDMIGGWQESRSNGGKPVHAWYLTLSLSSGKPLRVFRAAPLPRLPFALVGEIGLVNDPPFLHVFTFVTHYFRFLLFGSYYCPLPGLSHCHIASALTPRRSLFLVLLSPSLSSLALVLVPISTVLPCTHIPFTVFFTD